MASAHCSQGILLVASENAEENHGVSTLPPRDLAWRSENGEENHGVSTFLPGDLAWRIVIFVMPYLSC